MDKLTAVLCLIFSGTLACGQILFKLAAEDIRLRSEQPILAMVFSPWLIGAIALYATLTILWVYVLTRAPLSVAYPFSLLGSAIVPILAALLLDEALSTKSAIGFMIVLFGLATMYLF
jgi:drug/metabolite transporter (DMT)-like permease